MPSDLDKIPEVDFVPKTIEEIQSSMISAYEKEYLNQTGQSISLPAASEERIYLNTAAVFIYQGYQLIDNGIKMNLLKYSAGAYLDNLVAMVGVSRLEAKYAISKVRFTLSALQAEDITIPSGTRVSTANQLFFRTDADCLIPAGQQTADCTITCEKNGAVGNGCVQGQINVLVDPVAFVSKVENIEVSQGGADVESDDSLRLRAYLKPQSFSVAGPEKAYEYFVREYSQAIEGVKVAKTSPGVVDIRVTLTNAELPSETFLTGLKESLTDKRPLTDDLSISAPDIAEYQVAGIYYISSDDEKMEQTIKDQVESTLQKYQQWQSAKIGRDITPDKLVSLVNAAGAKRLVLTQPVYTVVNAQSIAKCTAAALTYGGIENE